MTELESLMRQYFLDTNILLRIVDRSSSEHELVVRAIASIFKNGDQCVITPQTLIEFWVVATRPIEVNGFGWTITETREKLERLISQFVLLEETKDIFVNWFQLVETHGIKGKRTHDLRLVAVAKSYAIDYLLTLNTRDFVVIPEVTIADPRNIFTPD